MPRWRELNTRAARPSSDYCPFGRAETLEAGIIEMFRHEWSMHGLDRPLRSIAIVDDIPEQQYLYPEFLLFQQLFHRHGLKAVIVDPPS
ncbi:hypothetical protein QNM99_11585 [Pseudomonas sp. PCH446]